MKYLSYLFLYKLYLRVVTQLMTERFFCKETAQQTNYEKRADENIATNEVLG